MQAEPKKVMRLEEVPPSEIVDVIWYGEKKAPGQQMYVISLTFFKPFGVAVHRVL